MSTSLHVSAPAPPAQKPRAVPVTVPADAC